MPRAALACIFAALSAAGPALAQTPAPNPKVQVSPQALRAAEEAAKPVSKAELAAVLSELRQTRARLAALEAQLKDHTHPYPRGDDGSCAMKHPASADDDSVVVQPPKPLGSCRTGRPGDS